MGTQKFSKEQIQLIINMYVLENYSITEIRKECGFSIHRNTIMYHFKKNGIKLVKKFGRKYDLLGKTFGYLTVIKVIQTDKSTPKHIWRAICTCNNCGKENFDVDPHALLTGNTISCGCYRNNLPKIIGKKNISFIGCEEISGKFWNQIRKQGIKRGHEFNINIQYLWNLYLQQNKKCALSGLPIKFSVTDKKSNETTASLDRIDSTKGYVEGNVQWVHKHINIMKSAHEQNYFISLCKLIANNN